MSKKIAQSVTKGESVARAQYEMNEAQRAPSAPSRTRQVLKVSKSADKVLKNSTSSTGHTKVASFIKKVIEAGVNYPFKQMMQPSGDDSGENPGQRLYRQGMAMKIEKHKLTTMVRKELAEKEIREHCTFKPDLVSKDYYQTSGVQHSFYEMKRRMREEQARLQMFGNTANFNGLEKQ